MLISRRKLLGGASALAGVAGLSGLAHWLGKEPPSPPAAKLPAEPVSGTPKEKPPNFIVIISDDQRWDAIGFLGRSVVHTPNLDKLAKESQRFSNMFVTTSICPCSRASIMTGQHSRRHGIWGFHEALKEEQLRNTFPALMRQAGYFTGYFGKWGLGGAMPDRHFDMWTGFSDIFTYFPGGKNITLTNTNEAVYFLQNAPKIMPFLLMVGYKAPHDPFTPMAESAKYYKNVEVKKPELSMTTDARLIRQFFGGSFQRGSAHELLLSDNNFQRTVLAYYRLITEMDWGVGQILKALEERGEADNTYVIFTSDNGYMLGQQGLMGKCTMFEDSIRVPLMIRHIAGRRNERNYDVTNDNMALNIDIGPTVLDLAGQQVPERMQGRSLAAAADPDVEWRDRFYYEHRYDQRSIPRCEGMRTQEWKLSRYELHGRKLLTLYNLLEDPDEVRNLYKDPAYAEIRDAMIQQAEALKTKAGLGRKS